MNPPQRPHSESGITHTEYLIVLSLIGIASITITALFGKQIKQTISDATYALQGSTGLTSGSANGNGANSIGSEIGGNPGDSAVGGSTGAGSDGGGFGGQEKKADYAITLYGQPTGMTCWSAATTMLFGGMFSAGPGNATLSPNGGLNSGYDNLEAYAKSYGLTLHPPQSWTSQGLTELLDKGPIMVAGNFPSGHAIVVGGYRSGGSADNTYLTIYDPWPPGVGRKYEVRYSDWMQTYPRATTYILQR